MQSENDYESVVQQRDALEKKLADIAAENAELKSRVVIVPAKSYVKDMRCNVVRWAKVIDALSDAGVAFVRDDGELIAGAKETPVTDELTRELMAKGVDALAVKYRNMIETMHPDTIAYGALKQEFESVIKEANKFAAQLRKGINDAQ